MRRAQASVAVLLTAALLAGGILVAPRDDVEGKAPAPRPRLPRGKSLLQGKITLKGEAPDLEGRTKRLRAAIELKKDDQAFCLACDEFEKSQQEYRLGGPDSKQVGNVFVWIKPERGQFFAIDDKQLEEAKKQEVVLRQPHCAYVPHCLILFPQYPPDPEHPRRLKPTGQVLKVLNDAPRAHNTNWRGASKNTGDNVILAPGKERMVDNLVPEATPIRFKCNIHPWMGAWMWVFDHPYATISLAEPKVKKDDRTFGTYEIKNVPAGKVRLCAWHERAGYLNKDGARGEAFELKDGEPTVRDFELEVPKEDR